jgi:hypothetical protein
MPSPLDYNNSILMFVSFYFQERRTIFFSPVGSTLAPKKPNYHPITPLSLDQIEESTDAREFIAKRSELFVKYCRTNVFKVPSHVVAVELESLRTQRQTMERQPTSSSSASSKQKNDSHSTSGGASSSSSSTVTPEDIATASSLLEQLEERCREMEYGVEHLHTLANRMEEYDTAVAKMLASGGLSTGANPNEAAALIRELDATHAQYQQMIQALRTDRPIISRPIAMQPQQQIDQAGAAAIPHNAAAFGW